MARQNKKEVVAEYLEIAEEEILKRWHEPTIQDMLRHLIEKGIVDPKRLRNYMIIYDFDCLLKFNEGNRTHTFMDLSIKYDISERQVQSVVYKERKKEMTTMNITF
jgi:predicted transcriptional regulator